MTRLLFLRTLLAAPLAVLGIKNAAKAGTSIPVTVGEEHYYIDVSGSDDDLLWIDGSHTPVKYVTLDRIDWGVITTDRYA